MLVNCAVYENGKKLGDIPKEEIHLNLGKPDRFVWVALRGHQRPKVDEYGDCLLAVMHTLELTEGNSELFDGEVNVFVGRDYLLSVRKRTRVGFSTVRQRAEREPH